MKVLQIVLIGFVLVAVLASLGLLSLRGSIGAQDAQFPELIGENVVTTANSRRRDPVQLRGMVWNIHYGYGGDCHEER